MIYFGSHHITRKVIAAFMEFFTNVSIQKYHIDDNGTVYPYKMVRVPIMFSSADRWLQVMRSATNLKVYDPIEREKRPIEIERLLPRMGLSLVGMNYLPERHMSKTVKITDYADNAYNQTTKINTYSPVPYSLDLELSIISKNINEGFEIVEQIIPFFTPSLSLDITLFDDRDAESIPFSLVSVSTDILDEFTETDDRLFTMNLSFNAKVNYYLPKRIDTVTSDFNISIGMNPNNLTDVMINDLVNMGYSKDQVEYEISSLNYNELLEELLKCLIKVLTSGLTERDEIIAEIKKCDKDGLFSEIIGWIIQELMNGRTLTDIIDQIKDYILNNKPKFSVGDTLFDQILGRLKLLVMSGDPVVNGWIGSPRVDVSEVDLS